MIKELALISGLAISGLSFGSGDMRGGSNCNPNSWSEMTDRYVELIKEYKSVAEDDSLTIEEKAERSQEISEEMRLIDGDCEFLNDDYNSCMKESNAQQRSDYDRCDRNGGGDKCYDRADKNNDNRRAACERVSHADNIANTVQSANDRDHGGGGSHGGSRGSSKKSSGISAGDRRR
jgi:hypothetical protein